jgi:DNA-binding transcriptional regulator/RsmH inhibitor MraZ
MWITWVLLIMSFAGFGFIMFWSENFCNIPKKRKKSMPAPFRVVLKDEVGNELQDMRIVFYALYEFMAWKRTMDDTPEMDELTKKANEHFGK